MSPEEKYRSTLEKAVADFDAAELVAAGHPEVDELTSVTKAVTSVQSRTFRDLTSIEKFLANHDKVDVITSKIIAFNNRPVVDNPARLDRIAAMYHRDYESFVHKVLYRSSIHIVGILTSALALHDCGNLVGWRKDRLSRSAEALLGALSDISHADGELLARRRITPKPIDFTDPMHVQALNAACYQ
ncbi:hypothetical protein LTR09_002315 [Extremus antarcticus]|uniref:Uncharacterized protein n=1 Tax=Extremus antarcticus TaxID=702011 RepID=A0AAJ0GFG0_9PEZI|nr:hypothetical protein LTR09_002315 [Extremus antarcticus]